MVQTIRFLALRKCSLAWISLFAVVVSVCCYAGLAEKPAHYEQGLTHYERNETAEAISILKESLGTLFANPMPAVLQQAIDLAQSGQADEPGTCFISLLDNEETAARSRYELGLIYERIGKLNIAARMFYKAQVLLTNEEAAYVGINGCKTCHYRQYTSWKRTKMARTFEVLKPGVRAEAKAKLSLDPQRDYTTDATCLECHTTGFGMPGGYVIPEPGDAKAAKRAKENEGTTCEACHGPGSKYVAIHKQIMTRKRPYTLGELCETGQTETNVRVCTSCHNKNNPLAASDYHFDYEKSKAEDTHDNVPLKYRQTE